MLLQPDSSGSLSPQSELTSVGKSISPSSMISEFPWVRDEVKIYSFYREAEDSLDPASEYINGFYTYEGIPPNGSSSPWVGGGHEWRQLYDLSAVCLANNISHDGRVARAPGFIYPAYAYASAEPYVLNGEVLNITSFSGGNFSVTLPTGVALTANQVASSIITQASSYQVGANVVDSAVVIRTTSGTTTTALASFMGISAANNKYAGSSAYFILSSTSTGVSSLGLTAGTYRGTVLNQINEQFNPVNHNGFWYTSEGETIPREVVRMYQWIKKTCGFDYVDDENLWSDPIK
jgi:hypothetical protein